MVARTLLYVMASEFNRDPMQLNNSVTGSFFRNNRVSAAAARAAFPGVVEEDPEEDENEKNDSEEQSQAQASLNLNGTTNQQQNQQHESQSQ